MIFAPSGGILSNHADSSCLIFETRLCYIFTYSKGDRYSCHAILAPPTFSNKLLLLML